MNDGNTDNATFNGLPADTSLIDAALYEMLDEMVKAELDETATEAPKADVAPSTELGREVCAQIGC